MRIIIHTARGGLGKVRDTNRQGRNTVQTMYQGRKQSCCVKQEEEEEEKPEQRGVRGLLCTTRASTLSFASTKNPKAQQRLSQTRTPIPNSKRSTQRLTSQNQRLTPQIHDATDRPPRRTTKNPRTPQKPDWPERYSALQSSIAGGILDRKTRAIPTVARYHASDR